MLTPFQIAEATVGAALAAGFTAGAYAYAAMWPPSEIFGESLIAPRNPQVGPGQIALTFDDGPNPRWTPQLLDILAQYEVPATFFLLGKYAATQHPLVQRLHKEGHLIGNHTWSHPNLAITSKAKTREELARTSLELEQTIGEPIRYFRPPFGGRRPATLSIAHELGLTPVLWNAITNDWDATDPAKLTPRFARLVATHQRKGYATSIVLHDGGQASLEVDRAASIAAAAQLIQRFSATCEFVTVDKWNEPFAQVCREEGPSGF